MNLNTSQKRTDLTFFSPFYSSSSILGNHPDWDNKTFRRSSKLALPYICRLMLLILLWPSTGPFGLYCFVFFVFCRYKRGELNVSPAGKLVQDLICQTVGSPPVILQFVSCRGFLIQVFPKFVWTHCCFLLEDFTKILRIFKS